MNVHLDPERTTCLVYGLMEPDEEAQAGDHLKGCSACADAVRRLEEERVLVVDASAPLPPADDMVRVLAARVADRVVSNRRRRIRGAWLLGCAAAAFLAAGIAFLSRTREIEESRGAFVQGRASVQRGEYWLAQADGYVPTPGDRIRTEDPAGVTIYLDEGSRFDIQRGSMVEYRGARGPNAVLRLLEGEVHCNVRPDPRPFTVEAAGTTTTVVGTDFAIHLLEKQPFFTVEPKMPRAPTVGMHVSSGAVLFRTAEGEVRVPAGWIALASTKGPPWLWGHANDLKQDDVLTKLLRRCRIARPSPPPAAVETAWKERGDAPVQALVDAVPWGRFADALVRHHRETDDAVRLEQRSLDQGDPDVKVYLETSWTRIRNLARELGVGGDFMQACRNKLAAPRFVKALVEALSGDLVTEEQWKLLNLPEALDNLLPAFDSESSMLERWKARAEKTHAFVRQLKEILAEDAHRQVVRNAGPSFFIEGYRVWKIEAKSVDEAADRIAGIWREEFSLPTYAHAAIVAIAARHVRSHQDARESFERERGDASTGLDELELAARLCDLQAKAERGVSEIPALNGDARARVMAGLNLFFRIRLVH